MTQFKKKFTKKFDKTFIKSFQGKVYKKRLPRSLRFTVLSRYWFRWFFFNLKRILATAQDQDDYFLQIWLMYFRLRQQWAPLKSMFLSSYSRRQVLLEANKKFGLTAGRNIKISSLGFNSKSKIYRKKLSYNLRLYPRFVQNYALRKTRNRMDRKVRDMFRLRPAIRNNFRFYNKDNLVFQKLWWKKFRYTTAWRPYSYLRKKQKIYFNWMDKELFKRYPIYRRKYPVAFEFPHYADYRRLFKNQIQEQHLFRWLYRLKYKQLVRKFKKSVSGTKRVFELMFLNFWEMRMDTIVYRLNFAFSIKQGKQWVKQSFFKVNAKTINWHTYHASIGDVIMPIHRLRATFVPRPRVSKTRILDLGLGFMCLRLFYRPIQADQYPSHMMINERIPAGLITSLPDPHKIRHTKSYSIQFLTLSLNRYS